MAGWFRRLRADAVLLGSALIVVGCLWTFNEVAKHIRDPRLQALDDKLILLLRTPGNVSQPIGPAWLEGYMRDLTALGSLPILVLFVVTVAGALLVRRQYHALTLMLVATLGGRLMNALLKAVFARPRPNADWRLTEVNSLSFPSGHAMDSAVIYLTLAALLAQFVRPRSLRVYFVGVAITLSFLAGFSRVFLGVHYPSDVLAGWTAGLGWALLCWTAARYLQRHGGGEQPK